MQVRHLRSTSDRRTTGSRADADHSLKFIFPHGGCASLWRDASRNQDESAAPRSDLSHKASNCLSLLKGLRGTFSEGRSLAADRAGSAGSAVATCSRTARGRRGRSRGRKRRRRTGPRGRWRSRARAVHPFTRTAAPQRARRRTRALTLRGSLPDHVPLPLSVRKLRLRASLKREAGAGRGTRERERRTRLSRVERDQGITDRSKDRNKAIKHRRRRQ
eukprot:6205828-Pleurochrysis_carterae.AAC.2